MKIVGIISLLLLAPPTAWASVFLLEFDSTFYDGVNVTAKTTILRISFSPSTTQAVELNKLPVENQSFTRKLDIYNSAGGKSVGSCTLGENSLIHTNSLSL